MKEMQANTALKEVRSPEFWPSGGGGPIGGLSSPGTQISPHSLTHPWLNEGTLSAHFASILLVTISRSLMTMLNNTTPWY